MIQTRISNNQMLSPIVKFKSEKLNLMFSRLRPSRQKRWESLGHAWKYVSGSPDADDLRIINNTMNSLIDQNNKQIRINSVLENRLKNTTESINSFINIHDNFRNETVKEFESVHLIFSLDELINQLGIIEEAITLARHNIPSSRIISSEEITIAQEFLRNSGLGTSQVNNILDVSSAYVLFGKEEIIYTLKVPRVKDVEYQLSHIEPVISNKHRIHLTATYYLKGPNSYLTSRPCTRHRNEYICNISQLEPLGECIKQLIDGESAQCPMEKVYGQNVIRRIDDANILVSAENVNLTSNCSGQGRELRGSYLIQFSGCTIKLNDEEYANSNVDVSPKLYLPTTGLTVTPTRIINKMPLQYLQEFNLEHRSHIEHLNMTTDNIQWKLHLVGWFSLGTSSTLMLILLAAIVIRTVLPFWRLSRTNTGTINTETPTVPGTSGLGHDDNADHSIRPPRFIPQ